MSGSDLEAEVLAELMRVLGERDPVNDDTHFYRLRPGATDAQLVAALERLRGLPSGLGPEELRRRLGILDAE